MSTFEELLVNGESARRVFRGVAPRKLVLAILATCPPERLWEDTVVSLRSGTGKDFFVRVEGPERAAVMRELRAGIERVGVETQPGVASGAQTPAEALARAENGSWVEPG